MKESEKVTERKLNTEVKARGGWSLKLVPTFVSGLPDRMVLMPGGKIIFVEVKSEGRKPTMRQELVHKQLRALGFAVHVIDKAKQIEEVLDEIQ